jgi:nucleoside-diphosphate-sugar epimerase
MNVFVIGATGVLGRPVSRMLMDSGHRVRALARNANNASRLKSTGVDLFRGSLFDLSSLRNGIKGCDAVLHLATRIPPPNQVSRRAAWNENDRIRTEGTRNLVTAALESDVSTFIYPSVVFVYPDRGAEWIDASIPPDRSPLLESTLAAESEVEKFTRVGNRGIILRMGAFYGPTAGNTRFILRMARHGIAMVFGRAEAYQPLIWVDDAALAVVDALSRASAGVYDVVDDEPLQRQELASALADAIDRRWLWRPPVFLFRLLAGKDVMFLTRSQRVSNRKFKAETAWNPTVPSAKVGMRLSAIEP